MSEEQAVQVLKQGVDVALSAGAFKSTQDVVIIARALEVLGEYTKQKEYVKSSTVELAKE